MGVVVPFVDRKRTRPTVARFLLTYPRESDNGLVLIGKGKVAHSVWGTYQTFVVASCGPRGTSTPAPYDALVCLRCFPWWRA